MINAATTTQTTEELPGYLTKYAADVDRWHSQALTSRETR